MQSIAEQKNIMSWLLHEVDITIVLLGFNSFSSREFMENNMAFRDRTIHEIIMATMELLINLRLQLHPE